MPVRIKIFLLLQFSIFMCKAQHPYFGSLNQALLVSNPAFAGSNKDLRVQTNYQNLYPKQSGSIIWYYASADMLLGKKSGVGVSVFNGDMAKGTLKESQVNLTYAHHFTCKGKLKVVPAFQASFFQYNLDRTRLNYGDMINPMSGAVWNTNIIPAQSKFNYDLTGGLLVYQKNFYAGVSVLSINQPDEGLLGVSKRPITQIYQAGYNIEFDPRIILSPYLFVKLHSGNDFMQVGTYFTCDKIKFHVAYRRSDFSYPSAYIVGFNYNVKMFRIGYNTIVTTTTYGSVFYSQEIYFSFNLGNRKKSENTPTDNSTIKLVD